LVPAIRNAGTHRLSGRYPRAFASGHGLDPIDDRQVHGTGGHEIGDDARRAITALSRRLRVDLRRCGLGWPDDAPSASASGPRPGFRWARPRRRLRRKSRLATRAEGAVSAKLNHRLVNAAPGAAAPPRNHSLRAHCALILSLLSKDHPSNSTAAYTGTCGRNSCVAPLLKAISISLGSGWSIVRSPAVWYRSATCAVMGQSARYRFA
jgi:hypothetical protein